MDEPHEDVGVVDSLRGGVGAAVDRLGLVHGRRQPRDEELHQGLIVVPGGSCQEASR